MNFRFLETFLWVARLKSFSRAAEHLNTTQASVSNRIAALEQELGVQLFVRDVRGVSLTPTGRLAFQQAQQIVSMTVDFRELVSNRKAFRGTVRIGAADTVVYSWLPALIRRMSDRYPGVSLDLTIDTSFKIAQKIQAGEVDFGIIMGPMLGQDVFNIEICTFELCWVCASDLKLPKGGISIEDIADHPLLTFSAGSQPHRALIDLLEANGVGDYRIYNSNSLSIMTRLLAAGVGVGALPVILVRDLINSGQARILDLKPAAPSLVFHIVYQDRGDNALARAITDMAVEIVAETPLESVIQAG